MRRYAHLLVIVVAVLTSGCAINLSAVRDFADETKKISVAFDPILTGAVEQCQQKFVLRRVYTSDVAIKDFDAADTIKRAEMNCQPIAEENLTAKGISSALADYATKLSAIAGDGVASSIDDDYDALTKKIGEFKDIPKEKLGAVTALFKFITSAAVARVQRQAIEEALSHEEAVSVLADALVTYTDRVYGAYVSERRSDNEAFAEALKADARATPVATRLQLMELYRLDLQLQQQHKAVGAMRTSVNQMKATIKDLRANLDKLSDNDRLKEVQKLAKEVRSLYQQLDKAF
ncbi:hypothetical protein [Ideonella sp. B508-1]|uniref:hypothetical protein n=1 Tax=Ideonella sp. B508-1 TaxID=137716 RepID=UPI0011D2853D|nr:hypothetical protein [Ideonella sp. B508-1]